ncbi:MAG: hypothetical protein U9Q34_06540, partial [Elusimicrobiota bacterium]|nr:hypothetical protein [Elusimicrobiota bacterium]
MRQSDKRIFNRKTIILIFIIGAFFKMGCNGNLPNNTKNNSQTENNSGAYDSPKNPNVSDKQNKFIQARKNMIETQIKARGIKDKRLLEALLKVERHKFVPISIR